MKGKAHTISEAISNFEKMSDIIPMKLLLLILLHMCPKMETTLNKIQNSIKNATITRRTIIIFQVKPENAKIFFYPHI